MVQSGNKTINLNKKSRTYKNSIGRTDYDIPYFSYKSSFFILGVTFFTLLIIPFICTQLHIDYRPWTLVFTSLNSGFSVALSQFFLERTLGLCKHFWIVGVLLSVFIDALMFVVLYTGIIM